MAKFNYSAAAELFPGKNKSKKSRYQRFSSAAEAVRYVMEELPKDLVGGSMLEVDEQRFNGAQIRTLYDDATFPLAKATRA
jgi:hypothetical protein